MSEQATANGLNPHYEGNFENESDRLRDLRLRLARELADAVAFVRKAGHLPGCGVSVCQHRLSSGLSGRCGGTNDQPQHRRVSFAIYKHDFQPGKCTCGHDRIVGSEGE